MKTDKLDLFSDLEKKREVLNEIKKGIIKEDNNEYPSLEIKPVLDVLYYKTKAEQMGGGHLKGATPMLDVTQSEKKRIAGYALISGKVYLSDIEIDNDLGPIGIRGLRVIGSDDIREYNTTPRKGIWKILGSKRKPIYGPIGSLLVTYTQLDSKDKLRICKIDSKLIKICEEVIKKFEFDKEILEVDKGLFNNDNANFFVF
tara:strand:+ start:19000 stop:19602 length:603 start_codon:yes stop_codon:yes gene_type:complete